MKGSKGGQGNGTSIFHVETGNDMFRLMIWGKQDLHETIMMWNCRKRKELFKLHCNAGSGKKIGDFSLDIRNCPAAWGMASGKNFQNGTVESWDVFWRTLLCVQKGLYDTEDESSHPSDILEPFRSCHQCGDMPPAAPCITVPVGNWKDSFLSLYTPDPSLIL